MASSKCTSEGAGYILECWNCRLEGRKEVYIGETSRSSYQRGREHQAEIEDRKATHPMVQNFQEIHRDQNQDILMQTIHLPRTALERQVWEAVMIDRLSTKPQQCLNLKTEWGQSKMHTLQTQARPKPREKQAQGNKAKREGREPTHTEEHSNQQR